MRSLGTTVQKEGSTIDKTFASIGKNILKTSWSEPDSDGDTELEYGKIYKEK